MVRRALKAQRTPWVVSASRTFMASQALPVPSVPPVLQEPIEPMGQWKQGARGQPISQSEGRMNGAMAVTGATGQICAAGLTGSASATGAARSAGRAGSVTIEETVNVRVNFHGYGGEQIAIAICAEGEKIVSGGYKVTDRKPLVSFDSSYRLNDKMWACRHVNTEVRRPCCFPRRPTPLFIVGRTIPLLN